MKYRNVNELMTSPAITCDYNSSIKQVVETMKNKNIGFIPIVRNNVIVGVITDRDIVTRGIGIYKLNSKINKIMTNGEIHFVSPSTPLIDAAKIMSKNKVRRLVVLNDGYVVGVITTKNMLKDSSLIPYIVDTYQNNEALPNYAIYTNSNPHDSVKTSDYPL